MGALTAEDLKALQKRAASVAADRVTYEADGKVGMAAYLPAGVANFTDLSEAQCYEIIGDRELERPNPSEYPVSPQEVGTLPKAQHRFTDLYNANLLARTFGRKLISVAGQFYAWTGTHWARDTENEAVRCAAKLSLIIGKEAAAVRTKATAAHALWQSAITPAHRTLAEQNPRKHALDKMPEYETFEKLDKEASAAEAWGRESEQKHRRTAALRDLQDMLTLDASKLDSDPWLLNCESGTIDLRTGLERKPDPADYITHCCPVRYNPKATSEKWEQFLTEIVSGGAPVVHYLQRWFGYCCTGDVREHNLVIHWGKGRNGKGSMLRAIEDVLSDYAGTAPPHLLADNGHGGDRHQTEIMTLKGKRLMTAHEADDGAVLREGFVKQMSGGDKLTGRWMYKDHTEFAPTHKAQLLTNHKPEVKGQDDGIWGRLQLVEYPNKYGSTEKVAAGEATHVMDTALPEKLLAEREGIFAWLVRGALEWQRSGLQPPETVLKASREYQSDQDRIGRFIKERCVRDPNARVELTGSTEALFTAYRGWCQENNFNSLGSGKFLAELTMRPGLQKTEWSEAKSGMRRRTYRGVSGLRLAPEGFEDAEPAAPPPEPPAPKKPKPSRTAQRAELAPASNDATDWMDSAPEQPTKANGHANGIHAPVDPCAALIASMDVHGVKPLGPKTAAELAGAQFCTAQDIVEAAPEKITAINPTKYTAAVVADLQARAATALAAGRPT